MDKLIQLRASVYINAKPFRPLLLKLIPNLIFGDVYKILISDHLVKLYYGCKIHDRILPNHWILKMGYIYKYERK
uniref:Uncharacterized protein n=1 Tax=Candidozyma auris TaxID=498019 RepID=A0A0L0NRB9_CANAR